MEGSETSLEQCTPFGRRRRYQLILCVTVRLLRQFVGTCQVQLPLAEAVTVKAATQGIGLCLQFMQHTCNVEMQVLQYAAV